MNSPERQRQIGIAIDALIREGLLEEDASGEKITPTTNGFIRVAKEIAWRFEHDLKAKYTIADGKEEEAMKQFADFLTEGGSIFGITNFLVSITLGDLDA